jgi:LCP family protein required for cell wall assembly
MGARTPPVRPAGAPGIASDRFFLIISGPRRRRSPGSVECMPTPTSKPGRGADAGYDIDQTVSFAIDEMRRPPRGPAAHARRRRRWPRILLFSGLALVLLTAGGIVAGWRYLKGVENNVERVNAFEGLVEEERPAKAPTTALNLLILGSDSRSPDSGSPDANEARTDAIMLAHVTKDHSSAQIVGIPRDTWVTIPNASGSGGGKSKINAAYARGGVPLMVRTVEAVTKVRIDHVLVIDFAGFEQIVDAVGGIDIEIEKTFRSIHWPRRQFQAGLRHLNGAEALDYSRQRKQFADGDFSRIEHQQQVVKAVLDKATSAGILTDLGKLTSFLTATAETVSADDGFNLLDTALALRGISPGQVRFLTSPSAGTGMEGSESVVYADKAAAESLYTAVNNDTAASWQPPSPAPKK